MDLISSLDGFSGGETQDSSLCCRLCREYSHGRNIISESRNFVVYPDMGKLTDGHVLICPKKHFQSIGSLPVILLKELQDVQDRVKDIITEKFECPVFFEHGSIGSNGLSGASINHAHMHVVPANINLEGQIPKTFKKRNLSSLKELRKNASMKTPYLFFEGADGSRMSWDVSSKLPSQYLRRIIAAGLKNSGWDWRLSSDIHQYDRDSEHLKNMFKKKVFFAQGIDNIDYKKTPTNLLDFKDFCSRKNLIIENENLMDQISLNEENPGLDVIKAELECLSKCDVLFVDMSIPDRNYIGCVAELTHAFMRGIPSIVYVGETGYDKRHSLRYHASKIFKNIDESFEEVVYILRGDAQ